MKLIRESFLSLNLAFTLALTPAVQADSLSFRETSGRSFSGQMIIKPAAKISRNLQEYLQTLTISISPFGEYITRLPLRTNEEDFARMLMATGEVESATPNWLVSPAVTFSDPFLSQQWYLNRIQAPDAWNINFSAPALKIAVIDTGIDSQNIELSSRLMNGSICLNGCRPALSPQETDDVCPNGGHGTSVAGVLAAEGGNQIGIAGTIPGPTNLIPIRVTTPSTPQCKAFQSDINAAISHAVTLGAKIVNISFEPAPSPNLLTAARNALLNDVIVVYSAGNYQRQLESILVDPALVIVGATNESDLRANFSNFGAAVDIAAPGTQILALTSSSAESIGYALKEGTSFSAPQVSGALALLWTHSPQLGANQVRERLLRDATPLGIPEFGFGILNSARPMSWAATD